MSSFGHGGNIDEVCRIYGFSRNDLIDFSANINPLGLNESVKREMIKSLELITHYPDITYLNLKNSISSYEKINKENIFLGNGAAEVIFNIVRALKPKKVLLPAPTFSEYEEGAKSVNGEIEYYFLNEKNGFKLDEGFLDVLTDDIDMTFICNPNNPTGVLTSKDFLKKVMKKCVKNNITLIVDESFLDFVKDKADFTMINEIQNCKNLIVVKSLTKFFAMPGIRIGYGVSCDENIKKRIEGVTISWCVNTLAEKGASVALKENKYIEDTIKFVSEEKDRVYESLLKISGITPLKPSVNYIMFKVEKDIDLKEKLIKEKILIRSCKNYKGIKDNYYRVAVKKKEENDILLNALIKILDT